MTCALPASRGAGHHVKLCATRPVSFQLHAQGTRTGSLTSADTSHGGECSRSRLVPKRGAWPRWEPFCRETPSVVPLRFPSPSSSPALCSKLTAIIFFFQLIPSQCFPVCHHTSVFWSLAHLSAGATWAGTRLIYY